MTVGKNGAEDGTRTRDPHLGKVMLYQLSHFRSLPARSAGYGGAESQNRTGDTVIFSHVLYQLSYLGASRSNPDRGNDRRVLNHTGAAQSQAAYRAGRAYPRSSGASPVNVRSRLIRSRIGGCVAIKPDARSSHFLIGLTK